MAEGARLESVFTGNRNVGSNPTPSATFSNDVNDFKQLQNRGLRSPQTYPRLECRECLSRFISLAAQLPGLKTLLPTLAG